MRNAETLRQAVDHARRRHATLARTAFWVTAASATPS
jgi:hypothetical protein